MIWLPSSLNVELRKGIGRCFQNIAESMKSRKAGEACIRLESLESEAESHASAVRDIL